MSKKSKSGHIGTCRDVISVYHFFRLFIQGRHDDLRFPDRTCGRHISLDGRVYNTISDLFCEDQLVSRPAPVIFEYLLRMHKT